MIDFDAHYEALYGAMRAALDADLIDMPIMPVTSTYTDGNDAADPPFIIYRQDVEQAIGTISGGNLRVMRSGWVITARSHDLTDSLVAISSIASALMEAGAELVTDDGYTTSDISINGVLSLYEDEFRVFAVHLRLTWERSR
jgi:hypothetical protein